jgi:hypothetical protein
LVGGMAGGSFVGRYQWEALPLALAFAALLLLDMSSLRPRAAKVIVSILILLALAQSWALFTSRPNAASFLTNGWDPASYLGWWGRLDPSPLLNNFSGEWSNARNLWGLGVLLLLVLAATLAIAVVLGGRKYLARISLGTLFFAMFCWVMALTSPFLLPTPVVLAASDLGPLPLPIPATAITVSGPGHQGTVLSGRIMKVLPGRYDVTIDYDMTDSSGHAARFEVRQASNSSHRSQSIYVFLAPTTAMTSKTVAMDVSTSGKISARLSWNGTGHLTIRSVTIAKVATCRVVECQGGWL